MQENEGGRPKLVKWLWPSLDKKSDVCVCACLSHGYLQPSQALGTVWGSHSEEWRQKTETYENIIKCTQSFTPKCFPSMSPSRTLENKPFVLQFKCSIFLQVRFKQLITENMTSEIMGTGLNCHTQC